MLTQESTQEISLLEDELKLFKSLYNKNLYVTKVSDGIIETINEQEETDTFTFGQVSIDTQGTAKKIEASMVEYRNKLRGDMEELQEVIPFTPEQLAKLAKSFNVIKDK